MNDHRYPLLDILTAIFSMSVVVFICFLCVKYEENKYKNCKYIIVDSHHVRYHAITYNILNDSTCVQMINEQHKQIIICGHYTIIETYE